MWSPLESPWALFFYAVADCSGNPGIHVWRQQLRPYCPLSERALHEPLQGQYDQQSDFRGLDERMKQEEGCRGVADRIFYLSIPPSIFTTVAACASQAASSKCVRVGVHSPDA